MEQSLQLINEVLDRIFAYGPFWIYVALFLAAFVENIFPPFPGDLVTLSAGAIAASGRLNVWITYAVINLGGILSVVLLYYLGKNLGRDYFIRKNFKLISRDDIYRLEKWFKRRGDLLLIFNRFIVGVRAAIAVISGLSNYNAFRTTSLMTISFLLFNVLVLFSGYLFVSNFETIARYFHMYEYLTWPIIIITVILFVTYKIRSRKKYGE
jgi:membrane protein DedA with SNARE-associated domain